MNEEIKDRQAMRIAIRACSDSELSHEAKLMRSRASFAQGMADKMEREIKRRKREKRDVRA